MSEQAAGERLDRIVRARAQSYMHTSALFVRIQRLETHASSFCILFGYISARRSPQYGCRKIPPQEPSRETRNSHRPN